MQETLDLVDTKVQQAVDGFTPYQADILTATSEYGYIGDIHAILLLPADPPIVVDSMASKLNDDVAWTARFIVFDDVADGVWQKEVYGGGEQSIVNAYDWTFIENPEIPDI